ncbi:mannosyl transferase [Colletotrichum truncatum]|uniref:Mannosyl transferase n=1 Tax=Colletotrichum truncatum TaxID=5467 RepID=A0ACC3ZHH3_COLTU|nr:mannosyl transferase [Colletotrichum truncatum]KAF6782307.1 mannosyl transferase [Colletotrichum truncatum]
MAFQMIETISPDSWKLLLGLFALCSAAYTFRSVIIYTTRKASVLGSKSNKSKHDKSVEKHEPYKMPIPCPYPNWSIETTKPLPYRAFRYGPKYHVTMGLRSVQPDEWIELDNHFPKYHQDKVARIQDRREKCVDTHPDAYPAAMELLEELVQYLPNRYPTMFKRTSVGIDNLWSGESFNIVEKPLVEDPMAIAAKLVQDDLAIMMERADGKYYLLAGAILLAGFWSLGDKYGMSLEEIHTSGSVPHYEQKLHNGMASFFKRLRCDQIYSRNNYFIQVDDSLPWSWSIGNEDDPVVSWSTAEKDKAIENHYFRSERQSLRRLPKTRAVVFTIRTYFHPITELATEDYVPGRLASAIRSWDDTVANYKGREKYEKVLLEYLDNEHQKQLDRGLDLEKEEEVHKYPW